MIYKLVFTFKKRATRYYNTTKNLQQHHTLQLHYAQKNEINIFWKYRTIHRIKSCCLWFHISGDSNKELWLFSWGLDDGKQEKIKLVKQEKKIWKALVLRTKVILKFDSEIGSRSDFF